MTTQTVDALVEDYVRQLEAASWPLAPDRRAELIEGIREHIAEARSAGAASEVEVRELLDRLGDPGEIAREAAREGGVPYAPYPVVVRRPSLALEGWAVGLIAIGGIVFPLIPWLVGIALVWASKRWSWKEKLVATLAVPGGALAWFAFVLSAPARTCLTSTSVPIPSTASSSGSTLSPIQSTVSTCQGTVWPVWLSLTAMALVFLTPIVVGFVLFRRARRRAEAESPYLKVA